MSFRQFLRDRLAYIAAYVAFGLLTVAVVQLDLLMQHVSLQRANLLYIFILGLVGLFFFLAVDYQRHQRFCRGLAEVRKADSLDDLAMFPEPFTEEQGFYRLAWQSLYARLRSELAAEQQRGDQNIRLISQWAHHMKTPVAVIDLELQKARRPQGAAPLPPAAELEERLASIGEENQRLKASLQALLNMVRLQDFARDFQVEQVDLVALVRQTINDQKRAFILHRVYPRVERGRKAEGDPRVEAPDQVGGPQQGDGNVPAGEPQHAGWAARSGWPAPDGEGRLLVESDAKWLRLVLEQIVSNAIKYSSRPDREGQVVFHCRRDGADVLLEVADNGIGVAPEEVGRVFDPFYTGSNGRAYPQSTGMGLYLAREICHRLGHAISLQSVRGEGTRVTLRFSGSRSLFATVAPLPDSKVTAL